MARPFRLDIAGNIGAGKTTLTRLLGEAAAAFAGNIHEIIRDPYD